MTAEQRAIHNTRRNKQSVAAPDHVPTTRSGAVITKVESKRMSEWLERRGSPNFSAWRRRAH